MHKYALIKCIKAGKNVYCEKPMVLSMEEVAEVKAAMEEYHYDKTAQVVFLSLIHISSASTLSIS